MRPLILAMLAVLGCDNRKATSKPEPAPAPTPPAVADAPTPVAVADAPAAAPVAAPPAEAVTKLAGGSNQFGFELYGRLRAKPGNIVISPASITTALAMTWAGARGETAAQMQKVLHTEGAPSEVLATAGALARSLEDPSRPIVFRIANQLFGEQSYAFEQAYLDLTQTAFGAPLDKVDFKTAHAEARTKINKWVESKTENKIVDLLPPDGVDKDTRLVLVNAIYFLGDWAEPFEKEQTRPTPFHVAKAQKKDVPMMGRLDGFRYAKQKGFAALELPYKGGAMTMLVIVPDAVDGLAAVEKSLDAKQLDALVAAMKDERVWFRMPKFEVKPAESLSLGDHLKAMGMGLAFDRAKADFTGIANPPNPEDRLVIAKVFHKAFVRVDEKGTEAAAATAVSMARAGGAAPAKPIELLADRPFLYLIRDTASGLVLFLGRVADPTTT